MLLSFVAEFEAEEVELSFSKNGEDLGVGYLRISKESLADRAFLPHVLCKNCVVELNLVRREEPFFPPPEEFVFIHAVPVEESKAVPPAVPPKTIEECEVCQRGRTLVLMLGWSLSAQALPNWSRENVQVRLCKHEPQAFFFFNSIPGSVYL